MLCSLVGTAILASAPTSATAAPLIVGLGGPAGFGTGNLPPNDDGYTTSPVDISAAFPSGINFLGMSYRSMYVNNNGNITFGGGVGTFTPNPFPVADQPMIAPWWGDVDTRGDGRPTNNGVYWDIRPGQVTVTWHNVGYFSIHDDLKNDFQLIMRSTEGCGIGAFDVEFRYNRCEWTTGDASGGSGGFGGTPAQAGFDAGNSRDYVTLPGSRTMSVLDLCTTSNVGEPGVWRFSIRGGELPCAGGGMACDTGQEGVCAQGINQCMGGGTVCVRQNAPSSERCDGLDNDCNGTADDGMGLCPEGSICDRGNCVPQCVEGSCFTGEVCNMRGFCVEAACETVDCPAGQRCIGGTCTGACEGVTCPAGQTCRAGACVNPCAGVTCEAGTVCIDGVCRLGCPCRPCRTGEACTMEGRCVQEACAGVTCAENTVCRDGACVDPCDGATCPRGERCEMGRCVPAPMTAPDAGALPDSGFMPTDAAVVRPDVNTSDAGTMDGGTDDGGPRLPPRNNPGCACTTAAPARSTSNSAAWLLGLAMAGIAVARRRRN